MKSALCILLSCAALVAAQAQELPSIQVPKAAAPSINGVIDSKEWAGAALIKSLGVCRGGKYQDKAAKLPTEVRLLWNEEALYVAFSCVDADIFSTKTQRDDFIYLEDVCEVFLDQIGDGRQYYEIQVSPNNAILDKIFILTAEPQSTPQLRLTPECCAKDLWSFLEWNMEGLRTATGRIVEDGRTVGWTVEIAIPAKALMKRRGTDKLAPCEMRANFLRYDWQPGRDPSKREGIFLNWSPVANGCPHISPAAMGRMSLVERQAP